MQNAHYSRKMFMKVEFCRQILEIYSNIKFHENLSSGNRVVPCVWADGQI